PSVRVPDYPRQLESIVSSAMAVDRAQRTGSAEALQLELEAFAAEQKMTRSPVAMTQYLKTLFPDALEGWQELQEGGGSIADFASRVTRSLAPLQPAGAAPGSDLLGEAPRRAKWPYALGLLALVGGGSAYL